MSTMKNRSKMLHSVSGVSVIGYTFALDLKKPMYERDAVLKAAEKQGLPVTEFPEPTKRNSFKNAMRSQMRQTKDSEKVLHLIEENENAVIFQVDQKVLENTSLWGASSQGGIAEIEAKVANYQAMFQVVYDKASDRVVCQNAEVLEAVYKLLGVYMQSYTKMTLSRYIRNLLETNTQFVPYIKGSGVYFVPASDKVYLEKIIEFMYELDGCTNTSLCEIPDLPNAQTAVAASVVDKFADMKREQETEINKLIAEEGIMTQKMKENRLAEIAKRGEMIRQYEILLNKELKEASKFVKASELMVKNFFTYGTITNPFQKIVDENKDNAEAMELIKSTIPDDVLELIDFD